MPWNIITGLFGAAFVAVAFPFLWFGHVEGILAPMVGGFVLGSIGASKNPEAKHG